MPAKVLAVHNDQYTEKDFDIVVTSIGNAFYRTDPKTGLFRWDPDDIEIKFLKNLFDTPNASKDALKKMSFERLYLAYSKDISINKRNSLECTRRECKNKEICGFIPNYPIIRFSKDYKPINKWYPLSAAGNFFSTILLGK